MTDQEEAAIIRAVTRSLAEQPGPVQSYGGPHYFDVELPHPASAQAPVPRPRGWRRMLRRGRWAPHSS
jgi:hypothetical protein